MKYDTAEAFRADLDQRIRNEATTTKLPVMRLRKRVAFERFLARLAVAAPAGNWVLKGAFALELRLDIQPIEMPVIAIEQHIAEKIHAYTATYGRQEQHSTRIKDLIDILLIADLASPHADRLHASLATTFSIRKRQPLPTALPPPPASWARPYTSAAADVGLPADLGTAHAEAATFLDPILAGTTAGRWNPAQDRWTTS